MTTKKTARTAASRSKAMTAAKRARAKPQTATSGRFVSKDVAEAPSSPGKPAPTIDTESDFADIDDIMRALESVPGIDADRHERETRQEQAEREYRVGLATIRKVAELTQNEVAKKLGVGQATVSRLESRPDVLLSTLKSYFDAVGAEATISVRVGNIRYDVDLADLI